MFGRTNEHKHLRVVGQTLWAEPFPLCCASVHFLCPDGQVRCWFAGWGWLFLPPAPPYSTRARLPKHWQIVRSHLLSPPSRTKALAALWATDVLPPMLFAVAMRKEAGQRGVVVFYPQRDSSVRTKKARQWLHMYSSGKSRQKSCRVPRPPVWVWKLILILPFFSLNKEVALSLSETSTSVVQHTPWLMWSAGKKAEERDSCWDYIRFEQSKRKAQVNLDVD